jgi:prepilin-type N-terminal cleavage/methylation domain-containing protein
MATFLHKKGFTLIELLIVMAIISILASIAIPIYRVYYEKAKLTEVINSMGTVASTLQHYYGDNGSFPNMILSGIAIKNTLGTGIPLGGRISDMRIENGTIKATLNNISPKIDGEQLMLVPDTTGGGINWSWNATPGFPEVLIPKK